jgi:hypothetical protein
MKSKIAIAAAAILFATGTAYAAVSAMGCCEDCCDEMRQQGGHANHGATPAPVPAPTPQH